MDGEKRDRTESVLSSLTLETMRLPRIATTFLATAASSSSSSQFATSLAASAIVIGGRHRPSSFGSHYSSSSSSSSSTLALLSLALFGAPHRNSYLTASRGRTYASTTVFAYAAAAARGGGGHDDDIDIDIEAEERAAATTTTAVGGDDGECNATMTALNDVVSSPSLDVYDPIYPGTSVRRLKSVHERVATLASDGTLHGPWESVRRRLLWAGGLRDLPDASPGMGYTGHSFNDYNHVDLTTMNDDVSDNLNDGSVRGIAVGNRLGPGVRIASLPELGPGGSWSTCAIGCASTPPRDVAHVQFRSRIAFKLVWVPNDGYDAFVLVNDDGELLAYGRPNGGTLPSRREREMNYRIMKGSKYAIAAERMASSSVGGTIHNTTSAT